MRLAPRLLPLHKSRRHCVSTDQTCRPMYCYVCTRVGDHFAEGTEIDVCCEVSLAWLLQWMALLVLAEGLHS